MQKARRQSRANTDLRPIVSVWFQGLFTPFVRVLFTFPLQYSFTIGLSVVFSLTRWCWQLQTEFHRLRPTRLIYVILRLQDYHLLWLCFPNIFCSHYIDFRAPPLSLATTYGITIVLFSSRYLDVSVPQVLLPITRDL